jgi:peroxiredoxin
MRKVFIPAAALLAVALAFTYTAFAADSNEGAKVGDKAPEFSLKDQNGKTVSLADFKGKTVVLEWFNQGCPYVVHHYKVKTMINTAAKYKDQDVVWLAINTTAGKTADDTKASAESWGIPYPILSDTSSSVAQAYGAKSTPHMFVIDKDGTLVYKGAINDDPTQDGEKGDKAVNYVAKALDEVLAGKPVSTPETKSYGCGVKYQKKDS